MHQPSEVHWRAVKIILKYLAGTINHGVCFSARVDTSLIAFTDANHASSHDDRRSTSNFAYTLVATLSLGLALNKKWFTGPQQSLNIKQWPTQ